MRLRQVVLAARDLDPVVDSICSALGLEVCYRDPGVGFFGLHNALMAVGDAFIEVVSPVQDGTAAGRYLDKRGGDGGYMVLLQVDDLDQERRRIDQLGVRVVWEGKGEGIRGMHLHPADVGGAIVSLDVAEPPEAWGWAGTGWRDFVRTDAAREITALEVQSGNAGALARRWGHVLDRAVEAGPAPDSWVIPLDQNSLIRFVPASDRQGEGISGFDVLARDRNRVGKNLSLGGVRVRLV